MLGSGGLLLLLLGLLVTGTRVGTAAGQDVAAAAGPPTEVPAALQPGPDGRCPCVDRAAINVAVVTHGGRNDGEAACSPPPPRPR